MPSDLVPVVMAIASGPVFEIIKAQGLKHLGERLKEFMAKGPVAVSQALTANYEEWVVLLDAWVAYIYAQQSKIADDVEALNATVERLAESDDSRRILASFAFEAMREALPARKEMLAAAAAYLLLTDMPIEEKARCERALRQLDALNVMQLYGLSRVVSKYLHGEDVKNADVVRHGAWLSLEDREVLTSAGCVSITPVALSFSGNERATAALRLTKTGKLVLRVLADYTNRGVVPFTPHGRERATDARSPEDARAFFKSEVPGLLHALRPLVRRVSPYPARYDFPDVGRRNQVVAPARPREPAEIYVDGVAKEEAERIGAMKPFHPITHENLRLGRDFNVVAVHGGEQFGRWFVRVHGPHDVLSVIADDLGVPDWNPIPPPQT